MPLVNILVNARTYTVACDEGEEEHLCELAAHLDRKVKEILEKVGQVGDAKLILMAALLVTDDYFDAVNVVEQRSKQMDNLTAANERMAKKLSLAEASAAAALDAAAKRVEDIAARLSEA
jgi:cell division protein ZapA